MDLLIIWAVATSTPKLQMLPCTIKSPELLGINKQIRCEAREILDEIASTGYQITDLKTYRPQASFSWRSYGRAIDINPEQNPCLGGDCNDTISAQFRGRWVAGKNGALTESVVNSFKKRGWCWGGDWCAKKDYMHFSKPDMTMENAQFHDECFVAQCPFFKP